MGLGASDCASVFSETVDSTAFSMVVRVLCRQIHRRGCFLESNYVAHNLTPWQHWQLKAPASIDRGTRIHWVRGSPKRAPDLVLFGEPVHLATHASSSVMVPTPIDTSSPNKSLPSGSERTTRKSSFSSSSVSPTILMVKVSLGSFAAKVSTPDAAV
jgi:hypothetical protein